MNVNNVMFINTDIYYENKAAKTSKHKITTPSAIRINTWKQRTDAKPIYTIILKISHEFFMDTRVLPNEQILQNINTTPRI